MFNLEQLSGKVAVVTGGTRGIGRGIALALQELGAKVVITGRTIQIATAVAKQTSVAGRSCEGIACDVTKLDSVAQLNRHLREKYGRLDILINNAGIGSPASLLHELNPEAWDEIFATNVRGVFYMMRELVPLMIASGGGHIVNISSLAGKNPLPRGAAYSASKWALNGLSYSVAEELRPHNIRVSVVCPGSVDTEFSPHLGKDPGKMLRPEDVAQVVVMIVTQRQQAFISEVLLRPKQKP
jgi:NAD(P)-dependent dehydrogenase (short-subunit alcohol dehydrogenase family)